MTWDQLKRRTGIMLCYPFEEARLDKWPKPWLIQPKLDGVRCRALCSKDGVQLLSSEAKEIVSVPHVLSELESLGLEAELDGELYAHGMSFEEIVSRTARTTNIHEDFASIRYYVFDLVDDEPQFRRLQQLLKMIQPSLHSALVRVPTFVVETVEQIYDFYEKFLALGYEGMVLRRFDSCYERRRMNAIMKFKPKKTDDYLIIGSVEEVSKDGVPKGTLGALICKAPDRDETFRVGSGLRRDQRTAYWEMRELLVGRAVRVSYQHTNERGVPRFGTSIEILN